MNGGCAPGGLLLTDRLAVGAGVGGGVVDPCMAASGGMTSGCDLDANRVLEQLFECPSSNERNTNTLLSGSESDAVKTPSVGSDSPGFCLQDVAPPPASATAAPAMVSCSGAMPHASSVVTAAGYAYQMTSSPGALPLCSPPPAVALAHVTPPQPPPSGHFLSHHHQPHSHHFQQHQQQSPVLSHHEYMPLASTSAPLSAVMPSMCEMPLLPGYTATQQHRPSLPPPPLYNASYLPAWHQNVGPAVTAAAAAQQNQRQQSPSNALQQLQSQFERTYEQRPSLVSFEQHQSPYVSRQLHLSPRVEQHEHQQLQPASTVQHGVEMRSCSQGTGDVCTQAVPPSSQQPQQQQMPAHDDLTAQHEQQQLSSGAGAIAVNQQQQQQHSQQQQCASSVGAGRTNSATPEGSSGGVVVPSRRPSRGRPSCLRGRPPKLAQRTYRSQLCDHHNPLKMTIRLERPSSAADASSLCPAVAAASARQHSARGRRRRRRRSRLVDSDDDDDQDGAAVRGVRRRGGGGVQSRRRRAVATLSSVTQLHHHLLQHQHDNDGHQPRHDGEQRVPLPASVGASSSRDAEQRLSPAAAVDACGGDATRQSGWADEQRLPAALLRRIFGALIDDGGGGSGCGASGGGAVPTLIPLARVCRLWRTVAADPLLWRSVDLNCSLVPEHQRHVRTLLYLAENRLSRTEELSLAGWQNAVGAASLGLLCDTCPRLQSLSLAGCHGCVSGDTLLELCRRLPALSQLDLSDVQPSSAVSRPPLSQHTLHDLCDVMAGRLRALNISHNCVASIPTIVDLLAANCANLELLDLSNMESAVRDVVSINIERLQAGCPHMRVLRWTNTKLRLAEASIKEQISSGGFPELEELSVAVPKGAAWGVDDAALERLLKTSRRLLLLDVRGCERVSDAGLVRVPAWQLQQLHVSGTQAARVGTESRLELLMRKWRRSLRELDLCWASHEPALTAALSALIDTAAAAASAAPSTSGEQGGGASRASQPTPLQLRRLLLTGSAVTFEPVARVIMAAPHLHHVDLTSCRSLPRGVKRSHVGRLQIAALREQIRHGRFSDMRLH